MSVLRVHKSADYTTINNQYLRNKDMSLKAKGLLTIMLSLPDNWNYSVNGLVAICKESKAAIASAIEELKEHGHLVIEKVGPSKSTGGKIAYKYHIYEEPKLESVQDPGFQYTEIQGTEVQCTENPPQLNTNKSNTKELNTKEYKYNVVSQVIDYLNSRCSTDFKSTTKETVRNVNGRIAEGYTVEDFKLVIDTKFHEWKDTAFEKYLVPSTLFRSSNFEKYLVEAKKQKAVKHDEKYHGISF